MRLVQIIGHFTILCFGMSFLCLGTSGASAWAQSGPRQPTGVFPPVIPRFLPNFDPTGVIETYNPGAPTVTENHPFFESLGKTNGRACVTCHEPRSAWSVSAASIRQRFALSRGTDPIFRPIDGATCPSDDVSTLAAKGKAYKLLLSRGLLRIFLPLPATRDFNITALHDPYGCTTLTSNPPVISFYRRPLPATNLDFLLNCPASDPRCAPLPIMWDGREPSLRSQATDATLGHAQATAPPTRAELAAIVAFETDTFDAQVFDFGAGYLGALDATGGPVALSAQEFFEGINDSLSAGFNPVIFTDYAAWENLLASGHLNKGQASVARGEILFNTRPITISGVNGLNLFASDPLGAAPLVGTCGTCHDSPNVGNHSSKLPIDIGIASAAPPALDISGLPLFTVTCTAKSPLGAGHTFTVTDLGRATISGKCQDVGKVKGPILHGLAARAPYFHNGSAATLTDVVNFYDQRFAIGFTDQEKADLAAFLETL